MSYKKNAICEVCGKTVGVRYCSIANKNLCLKHLGQFIRYGYFKDNNQRTINDLNHITIDQENNIAYIDLYDTSGNVIYQIMIDSEDVFKVQNIKWRITKKKQKVYVISGKGSNQHYLARYILNYNGDLEVDHIDGNELNNRKSNLRIVTRQENILNMKVRFNSKTQIRGVSYDKTHNTFLADFVYKKNRFYFKPYKTLEEAVYLRYLCEITYLKDFRNMSNDEQIHKIINSLSIDKKQEIEKYFHSKVDQRKLNAS